MEIEIKEPVEFLCETYYYLINGKKYWRVTQVKSVLNQAGLNAWRAKVGNKEANKIMKARQTLGTKVHKLFELILNGHKVNKDNYKEEEVKSDIDLMNELVKNCKLEPFINKCNNKLTLEQHLWSSTLDVAGTGDYLGYYTSNKKYLPKKAEPKFTKKSKVVGDWKSSAGIYPDYWLQLSAYVFMFEELTGIKLDGAIIAQFRDGKLSVEERTYEELLLYFEAFKSCIECFKYQKKEGKFKDLI